MFLLFTHQEIHCLPNVLSSPRFATYLAAKHGDKEKALALYQWNLEISSAFIVPLQIGEVSVRNSIVKAIEMAYGANWPWEKSFEISLRNPMTGYSPRQNIVGLRRLPTTGKIVAELKFVFWQKMFTHGHDAVIWNPYFKAVFPHAEASKTVQVLRAEGYGNLDKIRELRNRIAHHEPIFRCNIQEEYDRIRKMISWVDPVASAWTDKIEKVTAMIAMKP